MTAVYCCVGAGVLEAHEPVKPAVSLGVGGKLVYVATPRGDRIADFSYAGYEGGGVSPPHPPVLTSLTPSGTNDADRIQQAISELAARTSTSRPGALLLRAGTYHLSKALQLCASGLVIRGEGAGSGGTVLDLQGPPHPAVTTQGCIANGAAAIRVPLPAAPGVETTLAAYYSPSGAQSITVADAARIHPGDTIIIERPVTSDWVAFMGMDKLSRNGQPERWVEGPLRAERIVESVRANTLRLTVPLTDSYDPAYGGGLATKVLVVAPPARVEQVGVETLSIICPTLHIALQQPHFDGVVFAAVQDGWVRQVDVRETTSAVTVGAGSRRITIEDVDYRQSVPIQGAAKPFVFSVAGTQVLVQHVHGVADRTFYYATQSGVQGPNVLRDSAFEGDGHIEPHQRWATGLLVEECSVPTGGIDLQNRGEMGSGHGWPIGWSVLWNDRARTFVVQNPPGAINWAIGSVGAFNRAPMPTFDGSRPPRLAQGEIESAAEQVRPRSLYRQQLLERLDASAPE